jgi:ligand-binding SRPBCC domain-containing protein
MRLVKETIEIGASLDAVWAILGNFGDVASWAPYMRNSALIGEQKSGVGASRKLWHYWGFRLEEQVTAWDTRRGFAFDVIKAPYPMKNVRETWVIERGNGHTVVASTVDYTMGLGWLGLLLDTTLVQHIVRREMRAGLRGLKACAERGMLANNGVR